MDIPVYGFDLGADKQIRADKVWAKGDTGTGIPIAILDTGIYTSHPEFSGRILKCHNEITNTGSCLDLNGHGTHTAGIAAAAGVNLLAKGVAPAASLYIDQVLTPAGSGTISQVIAGIDWATINHAKIISMSLGTSPISTTQPNCDGAIPSLTAAVNAAVSSGISVVAAAGNSGASGVGAPACISSTIAVGAVDSSNQIASFSSIGGPLADHGITAPGVNIFSTFLAGYATLSGTSMATPHVAGTIALMLKSNPTLSPAAIRNALFSTACTSQTSPSCPTGIVPNPIYGHGRVDSLAAFNAVAVPTVPPLSTTPTLPTITSTLGLN
jgi:subtilisin family serine protease